MPEVLCHRKNDDYELIVFKYISGLSLAETRFHAAVFTRQLVQLSLLIFKLAKAGISVDSTDNGLAAISSIKKKCYDAVLMDVQMPEMDGIEVTRIVRNELDMQKLPIIALTAHTMSGDRDRCLDAGMNDYIPKPLDRTTLFKTLKKNIESKGGQFDWTGGCIALDDEDMKILWEKADYQTIVEIE